MSKPNKFAQKKETTEASNDEAPAKPRAVKSDREKAEAAGKDFTPGVAKAIKAKKEAGTKSGKLAPKNVGRGAAIKASEAITRAPRGQYAGKKIKALVKEHGMREGSNRALRMAAILKAKNVDDVIGAEVADGVLIRSHDIDLAVEKGLISVS